MSVLFPTSTAEAVTQLAQADGALVPMAGGTDLLVHWPEKLVEHGRRYLDLSGVAELKPHRWTADSLVLGALTTYWDIVTDPVARDELPLLVRAARTVGAIQIQARGTWAGNVVNASPAADGVPALMAYDAVVVLRSAAGEEEIPLEGFYSGYKKMRRRPDQLVTAIRVPRRRHTIEIFEKVGTRAAQAITKVGLAIARSDAGWRVVANSVAPTVRRCPAIERMLEAETEVTSPEGFLAAIREDVAPIDDIRSTAGYREAVMARLLYYDLRPVCGFVQ